MPDLSEIPSYALLNGALCRLNRRGTATKRHKPLGSGVSEFLIHEERIFVRENGGDFLLGMPNLYCLDQNLFISWLAEMPASGESYGKIEAVSGDALLCRSSTGILFSLDCENGKILSTGEATAPESLASGSDEAVLANAPQLSLIQEDDPF